MKAIRYALFILLQFSLHAIDFQSHLKEGWYPQETAALNKALDEHDISAAQKYAAAIKPSTIRALIAPHAGISFSGDIAAAVYRLASRQTKRIIILAPDHSGKTDGIALPDFTRYAVPNGTLSLDMPLIKALKHSAMFHQESGIFTTEHSLEMQLPFIARYFPKVKIAPLIVGSLNCQRASQIANILKKYIDKQTLVVVSSDFIHYGNRFGFAPFADHQQLRTRHINSQAIELIEHQRCAPFEQFMQNSHATICGSNPIKLLLALAQQNAFGSIEARLIAYGSSSDNAIDDFVTYAGIVFTNQKLAQQPIDQQLTQQEKRNLLEEARNVLMHMFDTDYDPARYYPIGSRGVMQQLGAFATLRTANDKLRGCIGRILSSEPLYKTIATITKDAAINDSRFAPITKQEASSLSIKLSVLSKPKMIKNYNDIALGTDGIILARNGKSALFLPEVATEQNWNINQTLSQLAQKAGLDKDAWKQKGTHFQIFNTIEIPSSKNPT